MNHPLLRTLSTLALGMLLMAPLSGHADEPGEVQRPSESQLRDQIARFREMRVENLRAKSKRLFAQRQREAVLRAKAAKGDKKAARELAGLRMRQPVSEAGDAFLYDPVTRVRVAQPNAAQSIPTNVRANNPAGDGANAGQSEEDIVAWGDFVLAGWNDGQGFITPGNGQGVGASSDGGATWTDLGNPPLPAGYPAWEWTSDPLVAVNEATGRFFYCGLGDATADSNAVGVAWGQFVAGVFTWQGAAAIRVLPNATNFLDKQWLVADSSTGNVHVSYTNFTTTGNQIEYQRSLDGGATWGAAVQLSSAGDNGFVQGSRAAVGPSGEVYVVWSAIDQITADDNFRFRRSLDGGASFQAQTTPVKMFANFGTGAPGFNRDRGITFPSIAVDRTTGPNRGRVYLTWNESLNQQDENFAAVGNKSEVESNNTALTASPFTLGNTLRGTLSSSADLDYFSVALNAGQSIVLWADSLTSTIGYTLRVFAPTPDDNQRLAFDGDLSPSAPASQAFVLYTAPVAGTYFVRVAGVSGSSTNARYRIRAVQANNTGERGRDQRDVFVISSADGAAWSAVTRVNTDAVGFDNWLPEVEVGGDGYPYVKWYDHRDDTFGSRTHQYLSRSLDAGATWAANQRFSDFQSNFTTGPTNIAPNHGDYNALASSATRLHATWADTRDADINVYTAAVRTDSDITTCPDDTTMDVNTAASFGYRVSNFHHLYTNDYTVSFTSERAWPLPGPTPLTVANESVSDLIELAVTVPDTAALGPNTICMVVTGLNGAYSDTCCTVVTVTGTLSAGGGQAAFALRGATPNPALGRANLAFSLARAGHVALDVYDLQGARVRRVVDGELPAGSHRVVWDGRDDQGGRVRAGTYFVRLASGERSATQRFVFLR